MKKILFLLLISVSSYAQTTIANKLKVTGATKNNDATRVVVQDSITKEYHWVLKSTVGGGGGLGTVTSVTGTDGISVAMGTTTPVIGVTAIAQSKVTGLVTDLATKEDISNKDDGILTSSSTTYPTSGAVKTVTDATTAEIATKQATLVSGTNIKTVNGTALLGSGDLVVSGGSSTPNDYVLKYSKTNFIDGTGLSFTGFTPTYADGKIRMTGGTGNFSKYVTINNSKTTDENLELEVVFKVVVNGFGVSIGKKSIHATYPVSVSCHFDPSTSTINIFDAQGNVNLATKTFSFITVGDIIKLKYTQLGARIVLTIYNLTQDKKEQLEITGNLKSARNFAVPNSGEIVIFNHGGTMDIISIKETSLSNYAPNLIVVGDSKTMGYASGAQALRFSSNLNSLGNVYSFGGDGDRTIETVQTADDTKLIKAKYALMALGRNDLATGVSSATWQANYASIVAKLQAVGTIVYHLLPIPETTQADQSTLNTWLLATYGAGNCIDVATGWSNSTMLAADGTHPNEVGHAFVAKKIIDSGLITPTAPLVVNPKNNEVDVFLGSTTPTNVSNTYYLSGTGNDTTGELGNKLKPFLTVAGVLAQLPTDNGITYTLFFLYSATNYTMPQLPRRNLIFEGQRFGNQISRVGLDFSSISQTNVIGGTSNSRIYKHTFTEVEIISTKAVGTMSYDDATYLDLLFNNAIISWSGDVSLYSFRCRYIEGILEKATMPTGAYGFATTGVNNINKKLRIKQLASSSTTGTMYLLKGWANGNVIIDDITGTIAQITLMVGCSDTEVELKNISYAGTMSLFSQCSSNDDVVRFNNSVFGASLVINVGEAQGIITGNTSLANTQSITGGSEAGNSILKIRNFQGKIGQIGRYQATSELHYINSIIYSPANIVLAQTGYTAVANAIKFIGTNVFYQTTAGALITANQAVTIEKIGSGAIQSNATSLGTNVTVNAITPNTY